MDERDANPLDGPPAEAEISVADRERAHFEHARIVENAAKKLAPDAPAADADLISQETARHYDEVVKPSLFPKPNAIDLTAPTGVPDDQ